MVVVYIKARVAHTWAVFAHAAARRGAAAGAGTHLNARQRVGFGARAAAQWLRPTSWPWGPSAVHALTDEFSCEGESGVVCFLRSYVKLVLNEVGQRLGLMSRAHTPQPAFVKPLTLRPSRSNGWHGITLFLHLAHVFLSPHPANSVLMIVLCCAVMCCVRPEQEFQVCLLRPRRAHCGSVGVWQAGMVRNARRVHVAGCCTTD